MANIKKSVFYTRKFILLFISVFFVFVPPAYAVDVSFQWDPNSEPDLAGYRVFFREEGQPYDYANPAWEGTETYSTIYNLNETKTYYFVSRAFDIYGFESGDSIELYLEAETTPNNQPPIAVIAEDYIESISGTTVTLDGSRSTDADDGIASYLWTQVEGDPVSLSNPTSAVTTFRTPKTESFDKNIELKLTVTDHGGLKDSTDSSIYVMQNESPILNSVTISGPVQVNEGSGTQYILTANYSDGSNNDVTDLASWSDNSSHAGITSYGYLTASLVASTMGLP